MRFDLIVVGAGLCGATVAERAARQLGMSVLVVERRRHIAGNAYDEYDEHGLFIHRYGPHIFHTNSERVFHYLSQFTSWRIYQHRVRAMVDGQLVPVPVNLDTIAALYHVSVDEPRLPSLIQQDIVAVPRVENSRDVVVSRMGTRVYEKIFKNYTKKQWGLNPEALAPSVCGRIAIRMNRDDRYFTDRYQGIPSHGYTKMVERMLSHPNIHILLGTDFRELRGSIDYDTLVWTGPIDEYYDFRFGKLPYRSLSFQLAYHDTEFVQPVATINWPNEYDFTRVTEMKHLTGQSHSKTVLMYEFPQSDGDPYYPVPSDESQRLYLQYQTLARKEERVHFLGRLGTYQYYNMDQVVAQALHFVDTVLAR
ncbi:UDP-galactopyranose mutase [Alicyclobacillus vulcanalis]|uniref:UDP-galactopyranose mutase n=1 Tax=Alicyclobacillus vulcanalis TaxID=252246 RepID=A0A1N7JPB2_9BACL|nr:UDP-galactopyranose mutase [Alicyclobacillus vulcanalis]SIS51137.1 UDP-galactopyranose mutase [Alicyclobacillus vulcanalis]